MDRNSITGILLIVALTFAWMWYSAPSKEEQAKQKRAKDSLELVHHNQDTARLTENTQNQVISSSVRHDSLSNTDSVQAIILSNKYDVFASSATGKDSSYTIENELIKVTVSKKGGRVSSVLLKKYRTHDSLPLILFNADSSSFGLLFDTENNRTINTEDLYFEPAGSSFSVTGAESKKISMRLYAKTDGTVKHDKYIEYEYSLEGNSYMMGCKINFVGLKNIVASNLNDFSLSWAMTTPTQEATIENQQHASTVYYKYIEEKPEYLSETKDETQVLHAKTKWIAFKQQFFTSVIIADDFFDKSGAEITSNNVQNSDRYVKDFSASLMVPFNHKDNESFGMRFYFGPNHFQTLKKYDLDLEKQIPLGWGIFGWMNQFLVIPVFNFLNGFNMNYGIIILILTLIFKAILFPIAYRNYISSAKMRILKPEIDEINAKLGSDDPIKKQQATMALYKKAGVNPLAGCIPALLQMPILMALFRFFPASIELRQQGFWWVTDLSTYDSVWNFGKIPVIDFIYGDHVSIWALLCTITTLIYTHINSELMGTPGGQQQMPGMKYMMYFMPIMFLPFLNRFSAGLSYYYTLANIITFTQIFIIRMFVDEKKLHAKIEENKKKPAKVSGFQQKLQKKMEEVQRNQAAKQNSNKRMK